MIDETAWQVATADGKVSLNDFQNENGQPNKAQTLADLCNTVEDENLPIVTPEQTERYEIAVTYWSQRIAEFEVCNLSSVQNDANKPPSWSTTDYQKIPKEITVIEVLAAWLIYIARDTQMPQFQIGWDANEYFYHVNKSCTTSLLNRTLTVPFGAFIDVNDTFSGVKTSIERSYELLIAKLMELSDKLIHHEVSNLFGEKSWTMAASLIDTKSEHQHSTFDANVINSSAHGSLITLQINKQNGNFRWIYDTNQISKEEVDRISSRLLILLGSAKNEENANKSVAKLDLLPKVERELLLYTWNKTVDTQSTDCCLHELFETRVECNGQAIVVEYQGQTQSYSDLSIQANQLAHFLISKGVKPDDRIAICVERSLAMIVGILGILKAGCAYVPLDPVYKSQRLANILHDADPKFLLADAIGRVSLGDHQLPVIDLEKSLPADLPIDNPNTTKIGVKPTNLAYIIYTSGSTGSPKGVMVEHQQVTRLFEATQDKFDFNKEDKWCLFHSFSFDVSVWELWNAFYYGSQISIVPHNITRSTNDFYKWICTNGITVLNQTPSAFKMLLQAVNSTSRCDELRYIIFAGEELDPSIVKGWHEKDGTVIVNMYGPTETLHATIYRLEHSENISSIGRPLPDLRLYLLDSYREPVPLGAVGEIYISGAGVARGYLNRPELTGERFSSDPFQKDRANRMYRTGDLARYLPDGNLVFLGRADQQVKIRGFRIELGEIEALLIEHPQVHKAVVMSYANGSDALLVAYVVAESNASLPQNLRMYLLSLLPNYMIPAAYVCLQSLPLTPNGKLDQRALPAPDNEAFAHQPYEAPQGGMEDKLAQIWRKLLNIEQISRQDNFFALGGNSLLVPLLLSELRQIGLDITVNEVFDAPSLSVLASTLVTYKAVTIPPNYITKDSTEITPKMLPLITLSQADIDSIVAHVPGGVANIQDIYGLTSLQSGMLYHHLMAKKGDVYLLISRLRFEDRTSLERYADSIQQLIERHDILRTAIFWDGLSEPAQVVLRQVPPSFTEIKLNELHKSVIDQLSEEFNPSRYKLDLTQAPLIRLMAAPLSQLNSEAGWVALQLMHHSIVDHFTLEKLHDEIRIAMVGKIEMLSTYTPFRNFVAQTRLGISPSEYTKFFTEMLADIDEPTLPFGLNDIDRDGAQTNEVYLKLSHTINDRLRAYARNLQASLASICHLAWAQVLAKGSGRESVVFGTMLLGRLNAGEGNNSTMGPMFNSLPFRLNIDERGVETAVRDTHARLSALLAHEQAPLVLAQRCSGVPLDSPLFSALLNYRHNQKFEENNCSFPGVSVIDFVERTNYPLAMSIEDDGESLGLTVQVISSISGTQVCAYMQQALESTDYALTHKQQQPIRKLKVMPPEEHNLLLHNWNQTTNTRSPVFCLHQLFEMQVKSDGQAIAVECDGQTLSYFELNIQANRHAHYFISKGVKPDDRIAICVERSTTMIVGILGILKAGCAYVPLDPAYSSQRLMNILLDADPIFLLADDTGRRALGDQRVSIINLKQPLPADLPTNNPDTTKLGLTPVHLAYIIYTSGSTGSPKGVMVEHQPVVQVFEDRHKRFGFNKHDKWCFFHSISFDISVSEMWGGLCYGGQVSIVPYQIIRYSDELYDWICAIDINVLIQTPSAFKMLMRAKNISLRLDSLRYVIFGGEALDPMILKEWYEKYDTSQTILINMYGPTEAVMIATSWVCDMELSKNSIVPIGRPLSNKRIYLLDSECEPVLIGAEGEIYIGGNELARGYLNRAELTAECFLPDPFNKDPSARMYRTGDRARYLPDGNLLFLGRADQQVKIRGFRIELGEIESRLVEPRGVHEAIVQPFGNGSDARLVAYVVTDIDESLARYLHTYLSTLLPDYMMPAAYVRLPSLPLTPNGKLDRRALPTPDNEAFIHQAYEAPQDEIEEKLAQIWCELLHIDRISRHDNFFELGGHSLLVIHFVNKAKLHNMHIDARGVYSFPILKNLAKQVINRSRRFYCCDAAIPARSYGNGTPLFFLPSGDGDISYAFELAHEIDKNIPVYALPWSSPEIKQPSSIEEIASAMIPHMKKVQSNGPFAIAGYCTGGILALEMARQLINSGYSVEFIGLIDTDLFEKGVEDLVSETEMFLYFLYFDFPVFKTFFDSKWWVRVSKLSLDEAIEEIRKTNVDLSNIDIEWEAILAKQRYNYENLCVAYKIKSLPIKIHLFKAVDILFDDIFEKKMDDTKESFIASKLGREYYNLSNDFNIVSINGDHLTMISEPTNRSLLGKELTKCLQQENY